MSETAAMAPARPCSSASSGRRFVPRFSMRNFLMLITLGCCWLGWHLQATRRQQEFVEAIRDYGG